LLSPNGELVASGSTNTTIRLWDPATGAVRGTLEGHSRALTAGLFSPNGKLLASGSRDKTVRLWDPAIGTERGTLKGHSGAVISVAFSPDGTVLASGSMDKTVRLWNLTTGTARGTLKGHSDWVSAMAFSSDGTLFTSGSGDKTVRLWDLATGAVHGMVETDTVIRKLSFSYDFRYLETENGLLHTGFLLPDTFYVQPESLRGIFVGWHWVAYKSENLLWLPSDYRKIPIAVWNSKLILGHESGGVILLGFDPAYIPLFRDDGRRSKS